MRYVVTHTTTYSYDDDVTDSLGVGHLVPRPTPAQEVLGSEVLVDPEPVDLAADTDCYGNTVTYFQVTRPHRRLTVEGRSEVEVGTPAYDGDALAAPWERARPLWHPEAPGAWRATDFALPSAGAEQTDEAWSYAAASLRPGRPVGEAVTDLMHRIHADFRYDATATTVTSTVEETFRHRAGVCQDFAHLTIACLRSHGLAVRYVSGYLATLPPPGKDRVVGADASHAWAAVWVPGVDEGEWLALDPTNDQWVGDRYVTVAWGRDYGDVPPVKGVIFTEAKKSTLTVSVDVAPVAPVGTTAP
ncbi:transglutaminase family protein [Nocardioides mangrovi]|uniref:Transglutaminase family protein n=1 Tax=Nocardioides mangrovi TaxID=2874580 RepID=A0ABS7UAH3_9ACTN|nr:transglutaminase family protein [Nocardioides mangrovi]MBZ5737995.1 transglutaminase family protein [Nocardioides mangrovi]